MNNAKVNRASTVTFVIIDLKASILMIRVGRPSCYVGSLSEVTVMMVSCLGVFLPESSIEMVE